MEKGGFLSIKNGFLKVSVLLMMVMMIFISQSLLPVSTNASLNENDKMILEMSDELEAFEEQYKDASVTTTNSLKKELNKLVADKKIILSEKSAKLDFSSAVVKEDGNSKLVYIPVDYNVLKKGLLNESFFVAVFENNQLSSYQEIKIIGNPEELTSNVSSYLDGEMLGEETLHLEAEEFEVTAAEQDSSSLVSLLAPDKVEAGWWANFKKCLNDKGVAAWIISSISIGCGFACAATAGTGCIPCLLGLSLLSEGVISYCVFKAQAENK
ncbi:hypothetical protein [Lysinibacillus sp. 3P01SB]|uniref:hypothetical protein n=1 Tax=Lysinibacillus sp. 3P01SB TaxID=3132284 RepID=UPI0039A561EA